MTDDVKSKKIGKTRVVDNIIQKLLSEALKVILFYLPLNNIHEYPSSSVIDNDVRVSPIAIESRSMPHLPLLNIGHVMCN